MTKSSLPKRKTDTSAMEKQIDQLVYKLYNLTPEEIAIVEGGKYHNYEKNQIWNN